MSIAAPTVIGTAGTSVSGSTQTVTLTAGASAGDLIVVHFGGSNGRTLNSVTDTQSNTWNLGTGFSQTTVADSDWAWSILTTALTTSDTISTTLSGNASHAVEVIRCTSTTGWDSSPVDASATAGSAGATSVSVGPTGTTAQNDELSLLLVGAGGSVASWTATSPYTTLGNAASTGTIRHALSAYRVLTATSAETAAGTLGTSRAWAGVVTTFRAAAAGGTLYTRTGADTASASDALGRTIKLNTTTAETVTGSDALTRTISLKTTTANTVSGADSLGRLIVLNKTGSDTASASDAAVSKRIRIRGISDTASGSDSLARTIKLVRANSDTAPVSTDSATGSGGNSRSALDTASATDSADRSAMLKIRQSVDLASASDAVNLLRAYVRNIYDSPTYPSTSLFPDTGLFLVSGVTDIATRTLGLVTRNATDTASASDSATRAAMLKIRAISESLSISDIASIRLVFGRTASESLSISDSASIGGSLVSRSASDSISAAESLAIKLFYKRLINDLAPASDTAYSGSLGPSFTQHGGKVQVSIQTPVNGLSVVTPVYTAVAVENGVSPIVDIFVYENFYITKPNISDIPPDNNATYLSPVQFPSPSLYPDTLAPEVLPSDSTLPSDFLYGGEEGTVLVPVAARLGDLFTQITVGNLFATVDDSLVYAASIEE